MDQLLELRTQVLEKGCWKDGGLIIQSLGEPKRTLESLGALHRVEADRVILEKYAEPLITGLGLKVSGEQIVAAVDFDGISSIEAVSKALGVKMRPRSVTRIGARMARPEKAKERKMKPPPHVLFPLGLSGGAQRLVSEAREDKEIEVEVGIRGLPRLRQDHVPMQVRMRLPHDPDGRAS